MNSTCPACQGRGAVANAQTGSPQKCPLCLGTTQVSLDLTDQLFWYLISPAQLTANQQGVLASVTTDNDADFQWRWISSSQTGLYSVELFDSFAGNAPLMTGPINGENFAGTAQLPFRMPKPYPIYRTSTIKAKFNDRSGAPNTIQLCLIGYKIDKLPKAPTS
jgi:hypothetical protein